MATLNFDATTVAPDTGTGDPIPAGWYNVMIDESEAKPTKAEGGVRLSLRFTVLDGQYAGRKIFTGLNIRNANPVAQEIAYKQLSAICHAVGILQVQDSQQLHGKPLKVRVKVKPASGDYEASNDITAYKNINEQVSGAVAGAPAAGAPWGSAAPAAAPAQQAAQQAAPNWTPPAQPQQAPQQPQPQQAPAWTPPAAAQPWAAPQQQQPAPQQYAQQPQQAPVQQAAPQPQPEAAPQQVQGAAPPWMQQAAAQSPAGAPPWAQPQQ